jgi:hypothetical protein
MLKSKPQTQTLNPKKTLEKKTTLLGLARARLVDVDGKRWPCVPFSPWWPSRPHARPSPLPWVRSPTLGCPLLDHNRFDGRHGARDALRSSSSRRRGTSDPRRGSTIGHADPRAQECRALMHTLRPTFSRQVSEALPGRRLPSRSAPPPGVPRRQAPSRPCP